jgi:hypothetical protein
MEIVTEAMGRGWWRCRAGGEQRVEVVMRDKREAEEMAAALAGELERTEEEAEG